jgi:hypothetical protein
MENRAQVTFADAAKFRVLTGIPRAMLLDLRFGDVDAATALIALRPRHGADVSC